MSDKNNARKQSNDYPIDFVVLWVDGSDPKWLKKRQKYEPGTSFSEMEARYRDWGLFKYWFRGVEKYASWVNHVFLVTDDQKPEWLNEKHPKLTIVDHKEIMDEKDLPTFNSQAIEMNLHKIPGLSEHFVYFNDDMYLINKTKKECFFKNGLPLAIANINAATGMEGDQLYAQTMFNDILLINRHFNKNEIIKKHPLKWINPKYGSFNIRTLTQMPYPFFTGYKPFHMPSPLLKQTFTTVWEKERAAILQTCSHKFRHRDDLNQDIYSQWQICSDQFMPQSKHRGRIVHLKDITDIRRVAKAFSSKRTRFLCINDSVSVDIDNKTLEAMRHQVIELFDKKFPEKSKYEK